MSSRIARRFFCACALFVAMDACGGETSGTTDPVDRANDLLDSWNGRRERLEEAHAILEGVLARDPREYRALKEMSRYELKSRYISNEKLSNGKYIYSLGTYRGDALMRAETLLKEALQINPKYADGYIALGFVYMEARHFAEATRALQEAKRIGTDNPLADLNLANVYFAQGNLAESRAQCELAEALPIKDTHLLNDVYLCSLKVYKVEDNRAKAVEYYKKMADLHADNAWIRGDFAAYLRSVVGDFDAAVHYAREAVGIMQYGVGYRELASSLYAQWANLLIREGKSDSEVEPLFAEAYQLNPDLDRVMAYNGAERTGGDLVRALAKKGVSINARSEDGSTALLIAVNTGQTEAVKSLLEMGADPEVPSGNGWTPLLSAADEGNAEAVRLLLEHGADRNKTITFPDPATGMARGFRADELAERNGQADIARFIREFPKPSL